MQLDIKAVYCSVCQCNQHAALVQIDTMNVYDAKAGGMPHRYPRYVLQCENGHIIANIGAMPEAKKWEKDTPDLTEIESLKRRVETLETFMFSRVTSPILQTTVGALSPCVRAG